MPARPKRETDANELGKCTICLHPSFLNSRPGAQPEPLGAKAYTIERPPCGSCGAARGARAAGRACCLRQLRAAAWLPPPPPRRAAPRPAPLARSARPRAESVHPLRRLRGLSAAHSGGRAPHLRGRVHLRADASAPFSRGLAWRRQGSGGLAWRLAGCDCRHGCRRGARRRLRRRCRLGRRRRRALAVGLCERAGEPHGRRAAACAARCFWRARRGRGGAQQGRGPCDTARRWWCWFGRVGRARGWPRGGRRWRSTSTVGRREFSGRRRGSGASSRWKRDSERSSRGGISRSISSRRSGR